MSEPPLILVAEPAAEGFLCESPRELDAPKEGPLRNTAYIDSAWNSFVQREAMSFAVQAGTRDYWLTGASYSLNQDRLIGIDAQELQASLLDHLNAITDKEVAAFAAVAISSLKRKGITLDTAALKLGLSNSSYGQDTVIEDPATDTTAFNRDTVRMLAGVAPTDVMVTRDQDNLYLNLNSGADRLTISNWFGGQANRIERVTFDDGTEWTTQDLVSRIVVQPGTAGADSIHGVEANNVIDGLARNEQVFGMAQNDPHMIEVGWVLKSRRWRDGGGYLQMRENGVERRAA